MKLSKALIVLVSTLILLTASCGRIGDAGIYLIQANNLADEAVNLEQLVIKAPVTGDEKLTLEMAVASVKMLVTEVRRYDGLEDITKVDLMKMHRIYEQLRGDISYITSILQREEIWESYSTYEQMQLSRFYNRARDLSRDIDGFIEDPYNTDYLKAAAKISAYGAVVARIIFSVYKYQGMDLD